MGDYRTYFKNKKITLVGLGLLGRGVGDARFLAECGAELTVTDLKNEEQLKASLDALKEFSTIRYTLGEHVLEDFRDRDLIINGPAVPLDSPYIAEAKKNGIPVRMSADLLMELAGVKTVGVTGTRGKSTTTHLIAHTLKRAGKRVVLGGNVRGISNLSLLPDIRPDSILVLELDSWQLQGFGEAKMSPHVAVFTNLKQDHLNYYPSEARYFEDKANIFRFQKPGDVLVAGAAVTETWINHAHAPVAPLVPSPIPADWKLQIVGEHNKENASLAAAALRALGLSEAEIKDGLETFAPVEGRLQLLREINGVKIYNDNNATTPDATIAALRSFTEPVILIAGGSDKKLTMTPLVEEMRTCKKVLLLAGTGTDTIKDGVEASVYPSVQEALRDAVAAAAPGDVILFSPGFASFGMFKNEYDRNDQFVRAVETLQ